MISAFSNTLKIPELRQRIFFTLIIIVIVRVGAAIPLPGVNSTVLQAAIDAAADAAAKSGGKDETGGGAIGALVNVFSGGGLKNCAIFALGIMPYISASIMMQLLTAVVPQLQRLSREDGGRSKINMLTRYVTIVLCLIQGYMLARSLENPENNIFLADIARYMGESGSLVPEYGFQFVFVTVMVITAGTMLMMWLGEQVTERGIGNGISLIISVNIVSALPGALVQVWETYISGAKAGELQQPLTLVFLVALLFLVIAAVISITQAVRKITIQYAKRVVGRKVYGGQSSYLPLKVNYAGVMPIIFAQAIVLFPAQIIAFAFPGSETMNRIASQLTQGWMYYTLTGLLIFFFSYFWVATMFQPTQIADDLKKNGGYIPGHRPGKPTAAFLDFTMSRLTFAGAIFLTFIALLPALVARRAGISMNVAQFFGGTSLLILVGVLLDMMRQAETHLIQRHYDGFLRKGKIRGRTDRRLGAGASAGNNSMVWLYLLIAVLIIVGVVAIMVNS
ncbi:MAG: preprotein translocase subunit SecY [Verrucomicrobiales bacterium]|nr:preprotein translocase subunit SecY [Verrucomicrobiales bacterium]